MTESNFDPVTILKHTSLYYVVSKCNLKPILIDLPWSLNIQFEDTCITNNDILDIITNNSSKVYPFSIAIYSSDYYVKSNYYKTAHTNLIGWSQGQCKTVQLFLTPEIGSSLFNICYINVTLTSKKKSSLKDVYSNPHITEGNPTIPLIKSKKQDTLNQNFCVCEHPTTRRYFAPVRSSFKSLGMYVLNIIFS